MHYDLQTQLTKYNSNYPEEMIYKKQMLEILANCSNCFDRSCKVGHFTASAWLLDHTQKHFLLLHHYKLDRWFQLGGHCDGDTNVLNVAIKEAQEESGLTQITPINSDIFDLDIHLIPQVKTEEPHYHFDVRFLLQHTSDDPLVSNRESKQLQWFNNDLSSLPTKEPSIIRMFSKWQNLLT